MLWRVKRFQGDARCSSLDVDTEKRLCDGLLAEVFGLAARLLTKLWYGLSFIFGIMFVFRFIFWVWFWFPEHDLKSRYEMLAGGRNSSRGRNPLFMLPLVLLRSCNHSKLNGYTYNFISFSCSAGHPESSATLVLSQITCSHIPATPEHPRAAVLYSRTRPPLSLEPYPASVIDCCDKKVMQRFF